MTRNVLKRMKKCLGSEIRVEEIGFDISRKTSVEKNRQRINQN